MAATAACDLDRLLLYEPVVLGDTHGVDLAARMRDRLADGEREAAMERFYSDGAGVPAPERLPIWPERIRFDLVETVIREQHAVEAYRLSQVPPVDTPTLLLTGEHSPEYLQSSVQSLADRITKSTVTTLDGVGHLGIQSDPGQIATAIRTFHPKTAHTVGYST